ncbi:MAG TPA: hypothetical protein VJT33_17130 [bacterium]|nr:hypothetical protein [bacterium]
MKGVLHMWNFEMYEWMANERIVTYQREAALDRLGLAAVGTGKAGRPARRAAPADGAAPDPAMRSARLGLVASVVGLAAARAMRRR